MTNSFVSLSTPIDQRKHETLVRVARITEGLQAPMLLVGAFARDILFLNMYGIEPGRRTEDVDISIQLDSWKAYDAVSSELLTAKFANPNKYHPEKFADINGQELDLLPFGEISPDGATIIWREDNSSWSIIGMKDALDHALCFKLADDDHEYVFRFITAPALVVLKMIAINDRPEDRRKKDGADIGFVMERYLDIGNRERLGRPPNDDVMNLVEGNLDYASALLLGRDIRAFVSEATRSRILEILTQETVSHSRCILARELRSISDGSFPEARTRLNWIKVGLEG